MKLWKSITLVLIALLTLSSCSKWGDGDNTWVERTKTIALSWYSYSEWEMSYITYVLDESTWNWEKLINDSNLKSWFYMLDGEFHWPYLGNDTHTCYTVKNPIQLSSRAYILVNQTQIPKEYRKGYGNTKINVYKRYYPKGKLKFEIKYFSDKNMKDIFNAPCTNMKTETVFLD
jgi:hypothetical protein